ncbi:MAG: hypothetical protein LBQ60_11655 [Bacteroidales bacterium]|nr:hypothetical protein [Bacteroidales bacterium]
MATVFTVVIFIADYMLFDNLPTARQKKRKIRKDFDKRLLALEREYRNVCRLIRDLGYEELAVPYQCGWKRSFVLRDEEKQSTRADFFGNILEKINSVQFSTRKDFKKKRRRRGKSGYVVRPQELKKLSLWEFQKMQFTGEEASWFMEEEYWCPHGKCWRTQYIFREQWRFVLKTEPNMITRKRKLDRELEQRQSELDRLLGSYPAKPRLDWLRGYGYKWYKAWGYMEDVRLSENPFKNKQKEQVVWELFEIDRVTPENISLEILS